MLIFNIIIFMFKLLIMSNKLSWFLFMLIIVSIIVLIVCLTEMIHPKDGGEPLILISIFVILTNTFILWKKNFFTRDNS